MTTDGARPGRSTETDLTLTEQNATPMREGFRANEVA